MIIFNQQIYLAGRKVVLQEALVNITLGIFAQK